MLSQNPELASEILMTPLGEKGSHAPSRRVIVDLSTSGAPGVAPQRKKLQLLPRPNPCKDKATPAAPQPSSKSMGKHMGGLETPARSEAGAVRKCNEDVKDFLAIRNIDEGEQYFRLPSEDRHRLVGMLVNKMVESTEADAQLVADLCTPEQFEVGFVGIAEFIDVIAIGAWKACNLFALMMKGAGLAADQERCGRIVSKSMDSEKLLELLA